jgi:glutamyl-tRNA synthetase
MTAILELIYVAMAGDKYYAGGSLETWLTQVKALAVELGYAEDRKKFKENPTAFRGDFATFTKIIRASITGRDRTPNLFYVLKVLGKERVLERIKKVKESL